MPRSPSLLLASHRSISLPSVLSSQLLSSLESTPLSSFRPSFQSRFTHGGQAAGKVCSRAADEEGNIVPHSTFPSFYLLMCSLLLTLSFPFTSGERIEGSTCKRVAAVRHLFHCWGQLANRKQQRRRSQHDHPS